MANVFKALIAERKLTKKEVETGKIQYKLRAKYYWAEIYYKISSFFTPIRVFIESIKSVYAWFPIIWKDRHWDHVYLLIILKHKLDKMAVHMKDSYYVENEKDAAKIRQAAFLVNRIKEDHYCAAELEEHYETTGRYDFTLINEDGTISRTKIRTEQEEAQDSIKFKQIINKAAYLKNQDYDLLFKLLKKNLEKWWT